MLRRTHMKINVKTRTAQFLTFYLISPFSVFSSCKLGFRPSLSVALVCDLCLTNHRGWTDSFNPAIQQSNLRTSYKYFGRSITGLFQTRGKFGDKVPACCENRNVDMRFLCPMIM